ncbi:hypothetical protein [Streptomyces galilaeus]
MESREASLSGVLGEHRADCQECTGVYDCATAQALTVVRSYVREALRRP